MIKQSFTVEVVFVADDRRYKTVTLPVSACDFDDARAIATEQVGAPVVSVNTRKVYGGRR
jgi:hypothetical protein